MDNKIIMQFLYLHKHVFLTYLINLKKVMTEVGSPDVYIFKH